MAQSLEYKNMNGTSGLRSRTTTATTAVPKSSTEATTKNQDNAVQVNPFVHNVNLTTYDKIKVAVLSLVLFPFRLVIVFACLFIAYLLACIGTIGLTQEQINQTPMKGWRRQLRTVICWWMCKMFFNMGFYRVTIKGIRATEQEAPILALAPHSSFTDAFPVVLLTAPSLVVKSSVKNIPFFHKLINYTQPVYVWREDPNSRQNTIKEIQRRVTSGDEWQQILIFPEGTCTNRKGLITFKPGAFYPGVPVQPVCIRYPNRLDTLSWTWQGPGALELIWLTMTQFYTYCELEFLPVYVPSEEEKQNPRLFASNVRDIMAKALDVPVLNYSFEDCRLMNKAGKLGLPPSIGLIEVQNIREEYGLDVNVMEVDFLETFAKIADSLDGLLTAKRFASYLQLPVDHPKATELFQIYDTDRTQTISFRKYVRGRCVLSESGKNSNRPNVSWTSVKSRLHLTQDELEIIDRFAVGLSSDANENDVLDQLYVAIPEWSWIVSSLYDSTTLH